MTRYGIDTGRRSRSAGRHSSSSKHATRVSSGARRSVSSRQDAPFSMPSMFRDDAARRSASSPSNVYDFEVAKRMYQQREPKHSMPAGRDESGRSLSRSSEPVARRNSVSNAQQRAAQAAAARSRSSFSAANSHARSFSETDSQRAGSSIPGIAFHGRMASNQGFSRQSSASAAQRRQSAVSRDEAVSRRDASVAGDEAMRDGAREVRRAAQEEPRGIRAKLAKARHDARHKRAERDFEMQVPQDRSSQEQEAPRAGVYRGEMGRNQKRAQRMQGSKFGFSLPFSLPSFGKSVGTSRVLVSVAMTVCLLMVGAYFVYWPAQDYYVTMRENAQMAAELEAINNRNDEISQRVDLLSTDAGVEDKLRNDFGWVNEGENAVRVSREGSSEINTSAAERSADVVSGSVPAPDTWYSGVLDKVFGYQGA